MKNRYPLLAAALTAAMTLTACETEEETRPVTSPPTVPAAETPATAPADGAMAAEGAVTVDAATRTKFTTLMEQVTKHISNREFPAAETGLAEMNQMRDKLDDAMKRQIDTTRAALTAARTAPAAPAGPPPAGPGARAEPGRNDGRATGAA